MPQNFISRYNNLLAVPGDAGIEYTAGPNIEIEDHIISGRDWTTDIDSAIVGVKGSGFSATTAWVDSQGYLTAHQDVSNLPYVQNSALGFKDSSISGISGSGFYAESAYYADLADHANTSDSATNAESAEYAYSSYLAESASNAAHSDYTNYADWSESAGFVISGWEYTDSAHTAIKGYSGIPFANSDAGCPWISGNKEFGAYTADFSYTIPVISSFDFSGDKNHYISLKGYNLTLPSTAGIASALGEKLDAASFNNFYTNGFNPNMTELHGATAYLSAFVNTGCVHNSALESTEGGLISSISGSGFYVDADTTPWISGDKVIDPERTLNFGDTVQMISSFNVSGYKNHAIALKGRQLKLPSTAHIGSALDEKLDTSAFTAYTATATGLAIDYSAGANINITDHVVSGKDWLSTIESGLSSKLDSTASANFVTSGDVTGTAQYVLTTAGWTALEASGYELSAGEGISIVDYPEDEKTVISVTGGGGGSSEGIVIFETATPLDMYPSVYAPFSGSHRIGEYDRIDLYFTNYKSGNPQIIDTLNMKNDGTATMVLSHPVRDWSHIGTEWICFHIGDYIGGNTGDGMRTMEYKRVLYGDFTTTATGLTATTAEPDVENEYPHSFYLCKAVGYLN